MLVLWKSNLTIPNPFGTGLALCLPRDPSRIEFARDAVNDQAHENLQPSVRNMVKFG